MRNLYKLTTSFILTFLLFAGGVFAQNGTGKISGSVTTSDSKSASYVTVSLKETGKGTISNENGTFEIKNVQPGSYTLKVTYVGIAAQERQLTVVSGETSHVNLVLQENSSQLNEVVVTGTNTLNKPVSLGKAPIRPLDLPQSAAVISSTVIQDQQATRLGDVVKNVSGVSLTQTRQGVAETFSARGYSIGIAGSGGSIFKNGVITNTQGFPDASTLESIEVLKGSSALLYGNVSGGVIINMVTKKPKFEWGGQASMQTGSYDFYKPTLDVYGPVSKYLAFRVVGTHENSNSYRDVVNTNRTYVNPSLLYKIGQNTDVLLQVDYLKSDIVPDAGVGVTNASIDVVIPSNTPRSRFINAPWAYNNTKQLTSTLTLNHNFNSNWRLMAIGSAQSTNVDGFGLSVPMAIAASGAYNRTLAAVKSAEDDYTGQLNLNGNFKTGFLKHQLLVGSDFTRIVTESNTFTYYGPDGKPTTQYNTININDPSTFNTRTDIPNYDLVRRTTSPQNRFGTYVQDLITLSNKFKVLAGLRWSYQENYIPLLYDYKSGQDVPNTNTTAIQVSKAFSPKAALIYQPRESTSLYASYSNNFSPNTGTNINGKPLDPSIIDQYEAGMKNEFFNGKLSANVSVYKIVNSNLAQAVPNMVNVSELSGQTTSDGLEVDFNGNLSKNFYFIAGYGYNYMRYTKTTGEANSFIEGERLINNPMHTANGSVFYTFSKTKLRGLKLGASAFYTGQRFGGVNNRWVAKDVRSTFNNLVDLTGFTTIDLSAGYTYRKISLLGKISNITNELNYIAHDRYSINPIPPRQFFATISYKF